MVGTRTVTQREVKDSSSIEERIMLIRMTLEEALYSKGSHAKNVPIIKSLGLLIELENELERTCQSQ